MHWSRFAQAALLVHLWPVLWNDMMHRYPDRSNLPGVTDEFSIQLVSYSRKLNSLMVRGEGGN